MGNSNDSKRAQQEAERQAAEAQAALIAQQNAVAAANMNQTENTANVNAGGTSAVTTGAIDSGSGVQRRRTKDGYVTVGV